MSKSLVKSYLFLFLILLLTNCGLVPSGYLGHSTNTQVILQEANYKVINSVRGQETASFILGIGPSQSQLYARAKRDMLESANLSGGGKSRALINITTDEQIKYFWFYFPVYFSKTVYITADVIEFI